MDDVFEVERLCQQWVVLGSANFTSLPSLLNSFFFAMSLDTSHNYICFLFCVCLLLNMNLKHETNMDGAHTNWKLQTPSALPVAQGTST